jgi:hypothetical protein
VFYQVYNRGRLLKQHLFQAISQQRRHQIVSNADRSAGRHVQVFQRSPGTIRPKIQHVSDMGSMQAPPKLQCSNMDKKLLVSTLSFPNGMMLPVARRRYSNNNFNIQTEQDAANTFGAASVPECCSVPTRPAAWAEPEGANTSGLVQPHQFQTVARCSVHHEKGRERIAAVSSSETSTSISSSSLVVVDNRSSNNTDDGDDDVLDFRQQLLLTVLTVIGVVWELYDLSVKRENIRESFSKSPKLIEDPKTWMDHVVNWGVHQEACRKHIAARNQHNDAAEEHLNAAIIHLTMFMQHEALYHEHIGARNQHRAAVSELEYSQPLIKIDPVACHAKGWWSFFRNDVEAARYYF